MGREVEAHDRITGAATLFTMVMDRENVKVSQFDDAFGFLLEGFDEGGVL